MRLFLEGLPLPGLLLDEAGDVLAVNHRFVEDAPFGRDAAEAAVGHSYEALWRSLGKNRETCRRIGGLLRSLAEEGVPFHREIPTPDGNGRRIVLYGSRIDLERSYLLLVHATPEVERAWITPEMQQIGLMLAEQEERRRIARELHDETFQQLTVIQFGLDTMKATAPTGELRAACDSIETALMAVQHQVRTLSFVLHPPELDTGGLAMALERFVKGFARRSGLSVAFKNSAGNITVQPEVELAIYRVAQEALANVLKHAEATEVTVKLKLKSERLMLEIGDNGIGIPNDLTWDADHEQAGVGLSSMRERIEMLAGRLTITRRSPGTLVSASIPCRRKRDFRKG